MGGIAEEEMRLRQFLLTVLKNKRWYELFLLLLIYIVSQHRHYSNNIWIELWIHNIPPLALTHWILLSPLNYPTITITLKENLKKGRNHFLL